MQDPSIVPVVRSRFQSDAFEHAMQRFPGIEKVLAAYPQDCQPERVEPLGSGGGFSGAVLWRITAARGMLCLRRHPPEHPDQERLRWIQSVVAHVDRQGFRLLPLAIATTSGAGFYEHGGYFWELAPWMPGTADYWNNPRPAKLSAAAMELARFHLAGSSFASSGPLDAPAGTAITRAAKSPGVAERLALVEQLLAGGLEDLRAAVAQNRIAMPGIGVRVAELFGLIVPQLPALEMRLIQASRVTTLLQPCLRDIWHDHVLFEGDRVTGIVDVGSMKTESVAADVARLLESFCGNDETAWATGQSAYEAVRPLSPDEQTLVAAFCQSQRLLAGVKWVQWVFMEHRRFGDPLAVVKRMEHILSRLRS
jgi:Ser/Thr protein kinase RdoA (MazF antagonist)